MDLGVRKMKSTLALGGLLALTMGVGTMHATVLSASASASTALTASIVCNTQYGPSYNSSGVLQSAVTITVHAFPVPTGTNTVTIGVVANSAVRITPNGSSTLTASNNTAGLAFTVVAVAGCANATSGSNSIPVQLTSQANSGTPQNDVNVTVSEAVTATTSALVAPAVTVNCGYAAGSPATYVPGVPQTVSVTSAAAGGTPFTTSAVGTGIVVTPAAPAGTATTTATTFQVQAAAGCGGYTSDHSSSITLANAPAPAVTITVNIHFTTISPLTATPSPVTMTYVKGSNNAGVANVLVTSSLPNAFFTVNTGTLPLWLTVNVTGGTVPNSGKSIQFSTTTQVSTLAPGNYSSSVYLQVSGYADFPVPITLLVTNSAPKLLITTANPMPVTFTLGGSTPVSTISIASSDSPIPYTISMGGALAPMLAAGEQSSGIAYSFGSNITINYNPVLFATSAPGTTLSGTVTFTWGSPAQVTVVTINLTVASAGATITSISPATIPTAAAGSVFHVTISGSGFVGGSNPALATSVGLVSGASPGVLSVDTNLKVTYNSPSNLDLQITVPATADPNLPFANGGSVNLGVVNGTIANGSTIPTGTGTLAISAGPIIYGITSSSSFSEVSPGNLPQLAPYDMISIFGTSFCAAAIATPVPANYANCSSTTIVEGSPDPILERFPFALSPDAAVTSGNDNRREVTVTFYPHGTLTNGLAAPLLFVTNSQINAIVPGGVTASPTAYDVVVAFGCPVLSNGVGCATSTVVLSAPFTVNTVPTDPGVFTIGSDGQGSAAALENGTYSLISTASPAGMRQTGTDSDTVLLYVTGLGQPNSISAATSGDGTCIAPLGIGYLAALNGSVTPNATLLNIDGAVLQSALFPGDYAPCITGPSNIPVVTIGGVPATVQYAGFVASTIAGLYQINAQLPASQGNTFYPNYPSQSGGLTSLTAAAQLPVFVTIGGVTSQAGVTLPVIPRLKVTAPSGISGLQVGISYTGNVVASEGSGTYTYAITSGILPQGLVLTQSGGNAGQITGRPGAGTAGTYTVTVTATDTSNVPVTGSSTFTITVAGGLYMTLSGTATQPVFGTVDNAASQVITPSGGVYPYTFAITVSLPSPGSPAPTGMTVVPSGGTPGVNGSSALVHTTALTPAGTYVVTVTATDATGQVTGSSTFNVVVDLLVTLSPASPINFADSDTTDAITTVNVSGGSGTYSYALDSTNSTNVKLLSFTGNQLFVGTAATGNNQSVLINVNDTGTAPTGGTAPPQQQITLTLTLH